MRHNSKHSRTVAGAVVRRLTFHYDHRGLPTIIQESNAAGELWASVFVYDARGRLITEQRIKYPGGTVKNWTYTYDQGGNRLTKTDTGLMKRRVEYTYDWSDPTGYGSKNNRLMRSEEYDTAVVPEELRSTTWYFYNCSGNVTRVVTRQESSPTAYTATRFEYAKNEKAVSYVLGETWTWNGNPLVCPASHAVTYAREFRYDGGRQRYLNRRLNPATLAPLTGQGDAVWTDYDGDSPYADYLLVGGTATEWHSYEPGVGEVGPWTNSGGSSTIYHHADHLGTLKRRTFPTGSPDTNRVYSAFGERLAPASTPDRYGYVGAHGYQTHQDFPFLHVGARYYDPSSGRFLQRDPIGIDGGTNVFLYAENTPTISIDPSGLLADPGPAYWFGSGLRVGGYWAQGAMGWQSYWPKVMRPISPVAKALEGAPDIARIAIACKIRRNTVLNPDLDANEGLDAWDKQHKNIKPGNGN